MDLGQLAEMKLKDQKRLHSFYVQPVVSFSAFINSNIFLLISG